MCSWSAKRTIPRPSGGVATTRQRETATNPQSRGAAPVGSRSQRPLLLALEVVIAPVRKQENRATARFLKPSAGLEPATPSLPWRSGYAADGPPDGQSRCKSYESVAAPRDKDRHVSALPVTHWVPGRGRRSAPRPETSGGHRGLARDRDTAMSRSPHPNFDPDARIISYRSRSSAASPDPRLWERLTSRRTREIGRRAACTGQRNRPARLRGRPLLVQGGRL